MNVRTKLVALFALLMALLVGVGATGVRSLNLLESEFKELHVDTTRAAVALAHVSDALWQLRYGFPQFLVLGAEAQADIIAAEPKWYKTIEEQMKVYRNGVETPEELEVLREWDASFEAYVAARPRWFELIKAEKKEEAAAWRAKTTTPLGAASVKTLSKLVELQQRAGNQKRLKVEALARASATPLWILIAASVLAAAVTGVYVSRAVSKSDALLIETSRELKSSAAELVAVAKQAEANAVEEAASVDETRRTMATLLASSNEIANSARQVLERVERTAQATALIADRISHVNAQAGKVTGISETIRAIADKTDILALNASLEGTRVGQAGRGFVLLGVEMRRLAETVTGAVREIQELAHEMQHLSQAAVVAAEQGQNLSSETTDNARQISLITAQQRTGTEQVTRSMDEIQGLMQQGLSGYRQARTTADDLLRTAESLARLVEGASRGRREKPSSEALT